MSRDDYRRLQSQAQAQEYQFDLLRAALRTGTAVSAAAILALGLLLPFFVNGSGDGHTSTLFQALGPEASVNPESEHRTVWLIPILATVTNIGVVLSFCSGATPGWALIVRRILAWAYLVGCGLGFLTLSAYEDDLAGAPIGLVALTLGGVLVVLLSRSDVLLAPGQEQWSAPSVR